MAQMINEEDWIRKANITGLEWDKLCLWAVFFQHDLREADSSFQD